MRIAVAVTCDSVGHGGVGQAEETTVTLNNGLVRTSSGFICRDISRGLPDALHDSIGKFDIERVPHRVVTTRTAPLAGPAT